MAIKAEKKGDTLELEMIGVVGDGWAENPITSKAIAKVLRDNPDAKTIKIALNSPGGYIVEGLQIYQALADHPARVEVTVGAQAASCGSLIAMAGDDVALHETSLFLIHNPWNLTIGDYQEHEHSAAELKMMADVFAGAYAKRSGMSKDDVQKLMDEDRYMNADEAKKLGFADRIIESKKKGKALSPEVARSMLQQSRSFAMNQITRTAAAALLVEALNDPPAPSAPEANSTKEDEMNLALIVAALGLTEGATEADVATSINHLRVAKDEHQKLTEALGCKSTDEALGSIKGLREKAEKLDAIEVEREQEKAAALAAKKANLITAASQPAKSAKVDPANPHAGKLVPAQKGWAESCSIETLEGWLANAPVILVENTEIKPPTGGSHNGKKFADMQPLERAALKKSDPETYNALRQAAIDDGSL